MDLFLDWKGHHRVLHSHTLLRQQHHTHTCALNGKNEGGIGNFKTSLLYEQSKNALFSIRIKQKKRSILLQPFFSRQWIFIHLLHLDWSYSRMNRIYLYLDQINFDLESRRVIRGIRNSWFSYIFSKMLPKWLKDKRSFFHTFDKRLILSRSLNA